MIPGLGELAPMNLSGTGDPTEVPTDSTEQIEPQLEQSFDFIMSHQMKEQPVSENEELDLSIEGEALQVSQIDQTSLIDEEEEESYESQLIGSEAEVQPQKVEAMVKFMVSLEGELGIEPEEMVQAMQKVQLEGQDLTQEQAVAKALAMVSVDRDDVSRAAELYAEYLVASEYGAGSLQTKGAVPVSDMNFQVMTKEQMRQNELASNVREMRSSFFASPAPFAIQDSPAGEQVVRQNSVKVPDLMNLNPEVTEVPEQPTTMSNYERPTSQKSLDSMDSMVSFMKKPEEESIDLSMIEVPEQELEANPSFFSNSDGEVSLEGIDGFETSSDSSFESETNFQSLQAEGENVVPEEGEPFSLPNLMTKTSTAKVVDSASPQAQPEVQVDNAQDLVDQAQVLVRKGGGQMKLKLNPEGLGEVNLKVNVQDGNVNIQMVADHSEAKKALEKGVKDLKETLALHKMNVEQIKVDVSSEISKHLDKQEQQDAYQREYARDFMGKMRDGNQNSRNGFLETPSQQYYQQDREEVNPIALKGSSNARANSYNHKGRLNLVA